jgi:hypothetical protein
LALNAKGGENIKPKAKEPHHHTTISKTLNNKFFQLISNFQLICESNFKTLLKAKGRIYSGGVILLSQRKRI